MIFPDFLLLRYGLRSSQIDVTLVVAEARGLITPVLSHPLLGSGHWMVIDRAGWQAFVDALAADHAARMLGA